MNKCMGCGIKLQDEDSNAIGYINSNTSSTLCKRCFRLKNYGEYLSLGPNDYYKDIKTILEDKESIILHIVDLFNIPNENILESRIKNSILVLNKRDTLPKTKGEDILLEKIKINYPGYMDYIIISSLNNYNLDNLYNLLLSKNKSKIYVIGYTNSGKSTLINKMIKNYSSLEETILTSVYPSTTLDLLEIKLNDNLTLVDTPGIIKKGSILKNIELSEIKKITINKEVKPIVFQYIDNGVYRIDKYCFIECISNGKGSLVIYASDKLFIERINKIYKEQDYRTYKIDSGTEIVITDLCFIKVNKKTKINIYIDNDISIYERNKLT